MAIVIDNSVVLAWCLADECDALADAAMDVVAERGAVMPGIWWYEVRNALVVNRAPVAVGRSRHQRNARRSRASGHFDRPPPRQRCLDRACEAAQSFCVRCRLSRGSAAQGVPLCDTGSSASNSCCIIRCGTVSSVIVGQSPVRNASHRWKASYSISSDTAYNRGSSPQAGETPWGAIDVDRGPGSRLRHLCLGAPGLGRRASGRWRRSRSLSSVVSGWSVPSPPHSCPLQPRRRLVRRPSRSR